MVSQKVLVSETCFSFESGFQASLAWSGRLIPEREVLEDATEQQHQPLVGIVDKEEHARRRRPWTRGFNTSALKGYESLIINRTLQLVEGLLSKNLREAVDLKSFIDFFMYAASVVLFALN